MIQLPKRLHQSFIHIIHIMQNLVQSKFNSSSSMERAQLVGSVNKYVTHNDFSNIIQNININNMRDPNTQRCFGSLNLFNGVPGLPTQVNEWLNSV
jgi:hypothetical protein